MNRFDRLVSLRQLQKESKEQLFSQAQGALNALNTQIGHLDQETEEARREMTVAATGGGVAGERLSPEIYEDFLRGQAWRKEQLQEQIVQAAQAVEEAREAWNQARIKTRQAEKLSEREEERQRKEGEKQDLREMDMVGVIRFNEQSGLESG
ncbi:MAG: flagellar export protein FliJ [Magnetococcales bacterium]|nr:flagellar export protein FliJ [Magnetococcales bacterium]